MPELILAIDVGTTSLGAGLFSPDGRLAGFASVGLRSISPAPGRVEQDASLVWRGARKGGARVPFNPGGKGPGHPAGRITPQRTPAGVLGPRSGTPPPRPGGWD